MEAADAIGDRAMTVAVGAGPAGDGRRIDRVFEWCLARKPTANERAIATAFVRRQAAEAATSADDRPSAGDALPWRALARGILNTDGFVTRE